MIIFVTLKLRMQISRPHFWIAWKDTSFRVESIHSLTDAREDGLSVKLRSGVSNRRFHGIFLLSSANSDRILGLIDDN